MENYKNYSENLQQTGIQGFLEMPFVLKKEGKKFQKG